MERSLGLSCLSVCLSVCLPVCLSVCIFLNYLNRSPDWAGTWIFHLTQQTSRTLHKLSSQKCPPNPHVTCSAPGWSTGWSCPARARTRHSGCQTRVCSPPSLGRNSRSRLVSSETPSNLLRLWPGHRKRQTRTFRQGRSCTRHWSCHRLCRLPRSS